MWLCCVVYVRRKKADVLGQGAFGVVYLGLSDVGELMAVKQLELGDAAGGGGDAAEGRREVQALENEINLLRSLRHPNIVRYIGAEISGAPLALNIFLGKTFSCLSLYIYIYTV